MAITSDPQYPWYDQVLPPGLNGDDQINANSDRQITQRYESINQIAKQRHDSGDPFPITSVLINGDLTAYGHDWQRDKYREQVGLLQVPFFPGLGNHDYANNVNDTWNNDAASGMVNYMYGWLKDNAGVLNYDFSDHSYYLFPELRTDYSGSLSYSFNLGKVHFVQLQNFPSYQDDWNSWNFGGARRDFYFIQPSFYWLANDLAQARNRGDTIIVSLHDYHDNFVNGVDQFDGLMQQYGVSAVFAGHIHPDCGQFGTIGNSAIPFFRSGAASYQDYLVANIDVVAKTMAVQVMQCPYDGNYGPSGSPVMVTLNDTVPTPPLPVPPTQGYVTFFNQGGFVARFTLWYTSGGQDAQFDTGDMNLGNKKTYYIPPYATDVRVLGKEQTGLVWEGWRTVFDVLCGAPPNLCYKLYGTTLNPKWNNDCS